MAPQDVRLSLIVGTLGQRPDGLRDLITSLERQSDPRFELVVVDQSNADLVRQIVAEATCRARRITSAPGLSRARNAGLRVAVGRWVGFPDDDVVYPPTLVASVLGLLDDQDGVAGLTAHVRSRAGDPMVTRASRQPGLLSWTTVWTNCSSAALFVDREAVLALGGLDERIGLGSPGPIQGGEDIDLGMRMLTAGHQLLNAPDVIVHHPPDGDMPRSERVVKGRDYATAQVWLLRRHRLGWTVGLSLLARGLAGLVRAIVAGDPDGIAFRRSVLVGRVTGLWRVRQPTPWPPGASKAPGMDHEAAARALHDALDALDAVGVEAWITDGTLLGCVREGGFIHHDKDVDIAVMAGFDEADVTEAMTTRGFTLAGRLSDDGDHGLELRWTRDGITLDIFVFEDDGDEIWHAAWLDGDMVRFRYPRFGTSRIEFLGRSMRAPEDPEAFLRIKYGDEWQVPRTDWDWAYSPLNAEYTRRGPLFRARRFVRMRRLRRSARGDG